MTSFLLDEMFPTEAAALLRDWYSRDAVHVREVGLAATDDCVVAAAARSEGRTLVTENVGDFAGERDVVLVFVLKRRLAAGSGRAAALAELLDAWARANPEPYVGAHWPQAD